MDELVFTREALRRELIACADALEKAAREYDPEELPREDLVVGLIISSSLRHCVTSYVDVLRHRLKQAAASKRGES